MEPRYARRGEKVTRRTHYLPAAWGAFWNKDYFRSPVPRPRDQVVWVLNLRSRTHRVYDTAVSNVFYEPGLGLAEITPESIRRHGRLVPSDPSLAAKALEEAHQAGTIRLDMEDCYTALESSPFYEETKRAIRTGTIDSVEQKIAITGFIVFLRLRHPSEVKRIREQTIALGFDPWVTLLGHWESCRNPDYIGEQGLPLAASRWILHRADSHTFPLGDYPALQNEKMNRLWVTLSPRLLLEICLDTRDTGPPILREFHPRKHRSLARLHRRLSIQHASREIIAHDQAVLEEWRDSSDYIARLRELIRG